MAFNCRPSKFTLKSVPFNSLRNSSETASIIYTSHGKTGIRYRKHNVSPPSRLSKEIRGDYEEISASLTQARWSPISEAVI